MADMKSGPSYYSFLSNITRKQMWRYVISLLLCIQAGSREGWSQSYYFRHYQVEQGLSNNTVFGCEQDSRGFIWMATKDGLNRFDGYSFKVFRNDPDDSTSIGDNFVRSLFIGGGDTLYAGTRNGVYRYNARLENFTTLHLTSEEVRDIKKDKKDNIWFVAGQTLHRFNERTNTAVVYDTRRYFAATSVCIDRSGVVWVATANGLLQRYDAGANAFTSFRVFTQSTPVAERWIEKIFMTTDSTLLIGTSTHGVKVFDKNTHAWKDILTKNANGTGIFARNFVQTSGSEVWIGTESGIFIYNMATGGVINLRKEFGNPYALSDNAVYSLCSDKEGGIWAGTYFGGINYYPKQYLPFKKYFPGQTANSLSGYAVREICEDANGNLWIGTEDAGLNKLNKLTGEVTRYPASGAPAGISYPNIHGLLVHDDELWIGTFEHGLDIMNIRTGKVIKHYPGNSSELRSNFIVNIYKTRQDEIYIGTRQGLYIFNRQRNDFSVVPQIPADGFIHAVIEDSNGTLWVGTLGQGLFYINRKTGKTGHFKYQPHARRGLNSNAVTTIYESSKGQIWIGTEGGGLHLLRAADSSFTSYTLKSGFPSNTILRVLEDDRERLWITTANGLVCFHPKNDSLNVFTTANGLLSNQFNYNSGYKDREGVMYFGSAKGLVSFQPGDITRHNYQPPVYITGFYINDKELRPNRDDSPLSAAVSFTEKVTLKHYQGSFSIDFAALSFTAPQMTRYQYITEGLDDEWTYLETNRKVYFTNLSPGTYTFRVRAANNDEWSSQTAQIVINILPPIWASKAAYLLYGLVAMGVVFLLVRSYHNRVKEKTRRKIEHMEHEKEKEIYQSKIDFFTNVAHEIKTPLTLVKAPMEQIAKKAGNDADLAYEISIMQRNTDRLIELTSQLLDFRKVETKGFQLSFVRTNITALLLETCIGFRLLADQKGIQFSVRTQDDPVMASVDTDSLQKILNNLLYNAFNYCKSHVEVAMSLAHDAPGYFIIEVKNDGDLIPEELKEKIFEPFYRVKSNDNKSGSGIGLALSRSLVNLHKGSIYFREGNERMNVFVLRLPIDQQTDSTS